MEFWRSLFTTVAINLILSGDNALMIALATRRLGEDLRKKAVLWGVLGAAVLQIMATFCVAYLITIPYLQTIGGILLGVIAVKLIKYGEESSQQQSATNLRDAIKSIIVLNFLMSLDNSLGVAGASDGNTKLLIISLIISIPVVIFCSNLIQHFLQKWPIIIVVGSSVLGYTAGEMVLKDAPFRSLVQKSAWLSILPFIGAAIMLLVARIYKGENYVRDK